MRIRCLINAEKISPRESRPYVILREKKGPVRRGWDHGT
jgi:hypothetical protein